jgi:hypothetical protein
VLHCNAVNRDIALPSQLGAAKFDSSNWRQAAQLFAEMATAEQCPDFLTLPAYDAICRKDTVTSKM